MGGPLCSAPRPESVDDHFRGAQWLDPGVLPGRAHPIDIIEALRARGLWAGSGRDDDIAIGLEQLRKNPSLPPRSSDYNKKLAARLWSEAVGTAGTPGEEYLQGRGLALPPDSMDVIRFHPQCQRGEVTAPALVILMRNVLTFNSCAIQRIFLEQIKTICGSRATP